MSERTVDDAIRHIRHMMELSNLGRPGAPSRQDQDNELLLAEIVNLRTQVAVAQKLAQDRIFILEAKLDDAQKLAKDQGAEAERLRAALRPFADAWEIATAAMPARTLAHFGTIAKHETSGVHFQRAHAVLKEPPS